MHILSFHSTLTKRVCRATVRAETYTLQMGVETTDIMRASFADLHGALGPKHWEMTSSSFRHSLWLTGCKSIYGVLRRTILAKTADKRLAIELASLRQSLWRSCGTAIGDS